MEEIKMRLTGTGVTPQGSRFVQVEIEVSDAFTGNLNFLVDGLVATAEGTEQRMKQMQVPLPRTASSTTRNQTIVEQYGLRTGVMEG